MNKVFQFTDEHKQYMKKLIISTLILCSPFLHVQAKTPQEKCTQVSSLSKTIMSGRQEGVPASTYMEMAGKNELAKTLVEEAFKVQRFTSDEDKEIAVSEFENRMFLHCHRALKK